MPDQKQGSKRITESRTIKIGSYQLTCYLPENGKAQQAVYLHTAAGEAEAVWNLSEQNFILIAIEGIDWNRDLSPWYHERVFMKGEDFAGKADDYLEILVKRLVPEVEKTFLLKPGKRYLVGYSLGGLFAIYAVYHTSIFDGIGSISGSLWYDGFLSYIENHSVWHKPDKIYFSLGDKEAASARGIMQAVFVRTGQIEEKYRRDGIRTIFEMNEGNHFKQVPERILKGISWLLL